MLDMHRTQSVATRLAVVSRSGIQVVQTIWLFQLLYLWVPAAAAAWRRLAGAAVPLSSARPRTVAVLIPAHDEAAVLGQLLADLRAQTHPSCRVYVVADNCSDATAAVARGAGASCVERSTPGQESTKQLALQYLWRTEQASLAGSDAVLVVDADHRLPADFVAALVACGEPVVQAAYREDVEVGNSVAALDAISRIVWHQLAQAGRIQLGLSALLAGSGMLFDYPVFQRLIVMPQQTIVEDRAWQLALARDGIHVHWTDATAARSEPTRSPSVLDQQRGRWLRGRWLLLRQMGGPLLVTALRRADADLLDKLYDQVQPPRSLFGLVLAGLTALHTLPWRVPGLWPARLLVPMCGAFVAYVGLGLKLANLPARAYLALLSAPVFMMRMAWITLVSLISHRYDRWAVTPHASRGTR